MWGMLGNKKTERSYMPINTEYPGISRREHGLGDQSPVYTIDNFLTPSECWDLRMEAEGLLERSKTHSAPQGGTAQSSGRTSYTCHLDKKAPACPPLLNKIKALTSKPFDHMELPQVARYTKDQKYLEHYDGIDPHTESGAAFCKNGGQRVCTVLVYLNDVDVGGCTYFRKLNLRIKPKAGTALVFFPAYMDSELDTNAIHCAEPAVDTKFVSQVWIRQFARTDGQPSRRKEPSAAETALAASVALQTKQRLPLQVRAFGSTAKLLHENPPFWLIESFLTKEECASLMTASEGLLDKSKTHAAPGGGVVASAERTSYTCHLDKKSAACRPFLSKVEGLTGKPQDHMELPQVARYTKDQRYLEHYDGIDPHTESGAAFCKNGGQRVCTVLVYLNDVDVGGCTYFRKLNLRIKPKAGSAIVFFPAYLDGDLDTELIHCAEPAVDQKWVAQVWIRQRTRVDGQPSRKAPKRKPRVRRGCFDVEFGFIPAGSDMHTATMTIDEARAYCKSHSGIAGFTFQKAVVSPEEPIHIWFKSTSAVVLADGWTSYVKSELDPLSFHVSSCTALKKVLLAKGWEEEDDMRPASFTFWQREEGEAEHPATRVRLYARAELAALGDGLQHARALAAHGRGASAAPPPLLRSRYLSLRDALEKRPAGGGAAETHGGEGEALWLLHPLGADSAPCVDGALLPSGLSPSDAVLAFKSLAELQAALLAAVAARKAELSSSVGGAAAGALSELLAQTAASIPGADAPTVERAFGEAMHAKLTEAVLTNADGRYLLQSVPRALLQHDGRLFSAHTYVLAVSAVERSAGGAPAGAVQPGAGGSAAGAAGVSATLRPRTQLYMSQHAWLDMLPAPDGAAPMSDGEDAPLVIPLVPRESSPSTAVALPQWDSWLPKMRAAAKEALASHPLFMQTALPRDECTQYALIECVWLFDRRGTPWLLSVRPNPNLFPTSGVDRHIKESLMKDLYSILIAPVVEDAPAENGGFTPL